ncbi:MAG: sialidase [Dehalococcoidia bacterium]|nr:sialidase [Dehalococcoidia bacterium]
MTKLPGRMLTRGVFLAIALIFLIAAGTATAQTVSPDQYDQLSYRHIGPVGNRIASVAGIPGDPLIYYVGAASGGIWKTVDGGLFWEPIFDDYPTHAVGALAVSVSDSQIVWAGTGEPHIRSNVTIGDGVWKSTDAGATWTNMGLDATGRISRVLIHPTDSDIVYVGALGHAHGPQPERGVYRTMDGGETWEQVLFTDENSGASSVEMDPHNPRILYAGMWTVTFNTWGRRSGGPGSGLFISRDAGDTWTKLEGNGLPTRTIGKVDVCLTPADSNRVYALIETGDGVPLNGEETDNGELWRSDDGAETWQLMTHNQDLGGRTAYYNNCAVAPDDPDEAYFLTAPFVRSIDGGRTGQQQGGRRRPGGDNHDIWIDPTNGDRMIVGNDGGLAISQNRGTTWLRVNLPIAQMYHVTADTKVPYYVYGNRQDGPSYRGPSNSRTGGFGGGRIPRGMWHSVGGGESGFATPDPEEPDVIWSSASGSGAVGGIVVRYDERTRQYRQLEVWPESTIGWPAESLRYRFQWTFPLLISPHDNDTIYVTSQHVHRTTNDGQNWEVISPDLTTNDKSKQVMSGDLTPDNIGVEYCCVIYAFDESPAQQGVFYAGSNDGIVHVSRDDGASWQNVTANLPDLPELGVVRGIDASKWDAGKAYLAIEFHQVGNFAPYVYRTDDYGESWTKITDGIADSPLSFARSIQEDPVREGLVYLGTENAVYVSFNDGDLWQPLKLNMPAAPIYGLVVQEHFNDLVVGTYGRGFWILDDLSPLQQHTAEVAGGDAHLFEPRAAYRFHNITSPQAMPNDPSDGENPPYGAAINYWLGSDVNGEVSLRIENAQGETVRTLEGTADEGINRIWWDLRSEPSLQIKLRTKPIYGEWVDLGDERWRSGGGEITVLEPPGTYTVVLDVDGREQRQSLEVRKDPNSEGSEADIAAQLAMARELRGNHEEVTGAINQLEWIRRQLYDLQAVLTDAGGDRASLVEAIAEVDGTVIAVEEKMIQLRRTGTGQDNIRWPTMLQGRLAYLIRNVATYDFPPNDQQREVQGVLQERMRNVLTEVRAAIDGEVGSLNDTLESQGVPPVLVVPPQ